MQIHRNLALALLPALTLTLHASTVTISGSSPKVTAAQHGYQLAALAVGVKDSNGVIMPTTSYGVQVNNTTFEVDFSGLPANFSGTAKIVGASGGSTNRSTDFQVDGSGSASSFTVCAACSTSAPAIATYGQTYYSDQTVTFTESSGFSSTVWVYFAGDGRVHAATSLTATNSAMVASPNDGSAIITYQASTSTWPSDVTYKLAKCTGTGSSFSCADFRGQ